MVLKLGRYWNNPKLKGLSNEQRLVVDGHRSGIESTLDLDMTKREIGHLFEAGKLEYIVPERKATYTPDFFVRKDRGVISPLPTLWWSSEEWWKDHFVIESKGRFLPDDRKKHLLIKKQIPFSDIRFVFDRKVRKDGTLGVNSGSACPIRKGSKTTYGSWCDKEGFLWEDCKVPDHWFTTD